MNLKKIAAGALAEIAEDEKVTKKILLTSDIHSSGFKDIDPSDSDLVIIAGDLMGAGTDSDDAGEAFLEKVFFPWCEAHSSVPIVITPGNHDKYLFRRWADKRPIDWPKNVHYLIDRPCTIDGLKMYGTPWCLKARPGRFEGTDEELAERFSRIPAGLDILISHTPPYVPGSEIDKPDHKITHEGSKELTEELLKKKPRLCICGHVHGGSHEPVKLGDTKILNVARVHKDRGEAAFEPVVMRFTYDR